MIDVKELKEKTYNEVSEELEKRLQEFKEEVNQVKDEETLKKMEDDLMDDQKEFDEYLKTVKYALPEAAEYDGERFTKNDIAKFIIEFLNRSEVEWSYTLGLYQLVKIWKEKTIKDIEYNVFDSTLRLLNNIKFKGFTDWKNILAVNEYLKCCHEPYSIDTSYMIYLAQKHQAIMDRTTLVTKVEPVNE